MFFQNKLLDRLYPKFHSALLAGDVATIKAKLKAYPSLAKYKSPTAMAPVISALHHSFSHQNTPEVLAVLKEYNADFNDTYYLKKHFEFDVNCELNPIAWLLLHGGDSRLIQKLIDCGTATKHTSIEKIKKLISKH